MNHTLDGAIVALIFPRGRDEHHLVEETRRSARLLEAVRAAVPARRHSAGFLCQSNDRPHNLRRHILQRELHNAAGHFISDSFAQINCVLPVQFPAVQRHGTETWQRRDEHQGECCLVDSALIAC